MPARHDKMKSDILRICLLICFVCPANIIGLWWASGSPLMMDPNTICRKSRRLGGKQHEICTNEREIVQEVVKGAWLAIGECQTQFRHRRWNCTRRHRGISRVLKKATRETAFVNAITAAGVVVTVTQACGSGRLLQCTCDNTCVHATCGTTDGSWQWGGCNDNVAFGYRKSREFMDVVKKRKRGDGRAIMEAHNNEAGRLAVRRDMRKVCKCHGLSGSCNLKTCWIKMPPFNEVGDKLKEKFDGATKVTTSNDGNGIIPLGERTIKRPSDDDLVYLDESPNYCSYNKRLGSLGTFGRRCIPKSLGTEGCELMCCGRGYSSQIVRIEENCNCTFHWCCDVICDTCVRHMTVHRCN